VHRGRLAAPARTDRRHRALARLVQRAGLRQAPPRHVCHLPNRGRRPDVRLRGKVESSRPGQVVVLHPDEFHDGRAGSAGGFGYRQVYVDPACIAAAVTAIRGRPSALPFVREPFRTTRRWPPPSPMRFGHRWSHWRSTRWCAPGGRPARARCRRSHGDSAAPLDLPLARGRAFLDSLRATVPSADLESGHRTEPLRIWPGSSGAAYGRVRIAMR